jgi:hypothetical protein
VGRDPGNMHPPAAQMNEEEHENIDPYRMAMGRKAKPAVVPRILLGRQM